MRMLLLFGVSTEQVFVLHSFTPYSAKVRDISLDILIQSS